MFICGVQVVPFLLYVARNFFIGLSSSLFFAMTLLPFTASSHKDHYDRADGISLFVSLVLLAPFLETVALVVVLVILQLSFFWVTSSKVKDWFFAVTLGTIFAGCHAVVNLTWGLIIFGMGIILSKAIIDWQASHSLNVGFCASFLIHVLNNFLVFIALTL
jgi:hypothetical protein